MKKIFLSMGIVAFVLSVAFNAFSDESKKVSGNEKPVRAILFYSSHCGACMHVEEEYLPKVFKKYGDSFQLMQKEISDKENFEQLLTINEKGSVPTMKIGDIVLIGRDKIEKELEPIIDALLKGEKPSLPKEEEEGVSAAKTVPTGKKKR